MGRIVTGHDARFGDGDELCRMLGRVAPVPAPEISLETLLERLRRSQRRRLLGLGAGAFALLAAAALLLSTPPAPPPVNLEIEVVELQGPEIFRPRPPIDVPAEFALP